MENYNVYMNERGYSKTNYELRRKINVLENKINKVIEFIEPLVEWEECTINGKMLKTIYDILKENK